MVHLAEEFSVKFVNNYPTYDNSKLVIKNIRLKCKKKTNSDNSIPAQHSFKADYDLPMPFKSKVPEPKTCYAQINLFWKYVYFGNNFTKIVYNKI